MNQAELTIRPFCFEVTTDDRFFMTNSFSKAIEARNEMNADIADKYAEEHWENNSHDYKMMEMEEAHERDERNEY